MKHLTLKIIANLTIFRIFINQLYLTTMVNLRRIFCVLFVATLLVACSSDDNSSSESDVVTTENFLGKWEHYATKQTKYNNNGEFIVIKDVDDEELNDPCYEHYMEFKERDMTFSGTIWEDGKYDCDLSIEYTTKWWYDLGDDYFTHLTELGDDAYQDRYQFHFDNSGNLIIWEDGYSEQESYYFKKL